MVPFFFCAHSPGCFPMELRCNATASNISAIAPRPATNLIRRRKVLRFGYQSSAPGPDLLTRSCLMRPFPQLIIFVGFSLVPHWAAAQTDANLSAHLHRLPTPPPYLRRMRLLHGLSAGIRWVIRLPPGRGAGIRWMMRLLPGQGAGIRWMMRMSPGRGRRCWMSGEVAAWPGAAFLQITARTNPCSRHLWGTLARAVASI